MIIREVKTNIDHVIHSIDWFNDYRDTRQWALTACPKIVERLDAGHREWMANRNSKDKVS